MSGGKHRSGAARPHREVRRGRRTFRSGLGGLLVAVLVGGQALGFGAWLSTGPASGIRQVQAATLDSPAAPTATQMAGGKTVRLAWAAVTNATTYEVRYYTTASGGTATVPCSASGTTCVDPANRLGADNWYSVVARVGTQWIAESARVRYTSDVTTTVSITGLGSDTGSSAGDFITKTALNTLTGTAEANATVVVTRGTTPIATATANGSGAWTSTDFTLDEGTQDLKATATDAFANSATVTKTGARLDTVLPTATPTAVCTTPGNSAPVGTWCKQTSLSMIATFDDAGSGLQSGTSQYENNLGGWTTYSAAVSLAEANGREVQLRTTDVAGNQVVTSATYYIDGTAPALTVTAPTSGPSLSLTLLGQLLSTSCGGKSACGTSSDATSGLASLTSVKWKFQRGDNKCYAAAGGWGSCTGYAFQDSAGTLPNWTTPMTGIYSILSSYTLTARATDAAGNVSTVTISFSTLL